MIRIAGQPSRLAVDKRPVSPITGRELRNRMSPYQRHVLAWMRLPRIGTRRRSTRPTKSGKPSAGRPTQRA